MAQFSTLKNLRTLYHQPSKRREMKESKEIEKLIEVLDRGFDEPAITINVLASYLLDDHIVPEHEESIIDRIHELFSEVAVVSGFDGADEWQNDMQASSGWAISVNEAARCLLDYRRTGQFFRGFQNLFSLDFQIGAKMKKCFFQNPQ